MKHEPRTAASATLRTADGALHPLEPGDLVGRLWCAALYLPDPRISECHAALAVVEGCPTLLGLRGRFRVDGVVMRDVPLVEGARIELAPGVVVEVARVEYPSHALHVYCGEAPPQPIHGVTTLGSGDHTTTIWRSHTWLRTTPEGPVAITEGSVWTVGATEMRAGWLPVTSAGARPMQRGSVHTLRFEAGRVTLVVGAREVRLRGRSARLLWELSSMQAPVHWWQVACVLWEPAPEAELRARWDMLLSRLRRRVRSIGGHETLLHSDGQGLVQLLLGPSGEVVGTLGPS